MAKVELSAADRRQWNALGETKLYSPSSALRRFQEWAEAGAFWRKGLLAYDGLQGIDWIGSPSTGPWARCRSVGENRAQSN